VTIVIGYYEVDPDSRADFIAARHERMRYSLAHKGCEEFAFCADPLNAGRVILIERWTSRALLNRHLELSRAENTEPLLPGPIKPPEIVFYEIAGEEPYTSR
jgi:quinol monooxygenase YgiN